MVGDDGKRGRGAIERREFLASVGALALDAGAGKLSIVEAVYDMGSVVNYGFLESTCAERHRST